MRVTVKLFATLQDGRFATADRELAGATTVGEVLAGLCIGEAEAPLLLVNGRKALPSTELRDGDVLAAFPPVGGG